MQDALLDKVKARYQSLNKLSANVNQRLSGAPDGTLHVSFRNGDYRYYIYKQEKDSDKKKRYYLNAEQRDLIQSLSQKEYDTHLEKEIQSQINALKPLMENYDPNKLVTIYTDLANGKKEFVKPEILDDDTYAHNWESQLYTHKPIPEGAARFITAKGDVVRSKTEKIIADTLYIADIPYLYEFPIKLQNGEIWHPDFLILNKRTRATYILEHFGMMDDIRYCNQSISKLHVYMQNGYFPGEKLLITFETHDAPFSTATLDMMIQHYFI